MFGISPSISQVPGEADGDFYQDDKYRYHAAQQRKLTAPRRTPLPRALISGIFGLGTVERETDPKPADDFNDPSRAASSDECSSSEEDFYLAHHGLCAYNLEDTIYCSAITYPLCKFKAGFMKAAVVRYCSISALLLVNYFVQGWFLILLTNYGTIGRSSSVKGLFHTSSDEMRSRLFMMMDVNDLEFSDGVCTLVPWEAYNPSNINYLNRSQNGVVDTPLKLSQGRGQAGRRSQRGRSARAALGLQEGSWAKRGYTIGTAWLNCRPDNFTGLESWEALDVNGDGLWTAYEAWNESKTAVRDFNRSVALLRKLNREIAAPPLHVVTRAQFAETAPIIGALCGVFDPERCGNLEVAGILAKMFPLYNDAFKRIDLCKEIVGEDCPNIMLDEYQYMQAKHAELCGTPDTKVKETISGSEGDNRSVKVKVVEYQVNEKFTDTISSNHFAKFMTLILFVWILAIFIELRMCAQAIELGLIFPKLKEGQEPILEYKEDDSLEVVGFSPGHRLFFLLCVCLPRTCLACALGVIGCDFLSASQSYQDAVLNVLALAFIMEVDEMIFAGIVSYDRKVLLARFRPLKLQNSCLLTHGHPYWSQTFFHLFILVLVAIIVSYWERHAPYGWIYKSVALDCFCKSMGPTCVESHSIMAAIGEPINVPTFQCSGLNCLLPRLPGWAIAAREL